MNSTTPTAGDDQILSVPDRRLGATIDETMPTPVSTEPIEAIGGRARRSSRLPGRSRRVGAQLVVIVVLVAAFSSGLAIGADPVAAHGSGENGCTGVPDAGYGFDFHSACDRHDRCYRQRTRGTTWRDRLGCDRAFLADMERSCNRHRRYSVPGLACRSTARLYYLGVRALGHGAWLQTAGPVIA